MIFKWESCPALQPDAVFYDDQGNEKLLIRQDGHFMIRGNKIYCKDLELANIVRQSIRDVIGIDQVIKIVEKYPNPHDSRESIAAWRKVQLTPPATPIPVDEGVPELTTGPTAPPVPHVRETDDIAVAGNKSVVALPVSKGVTSTATLPHVSNDIPVAGDKSVVNLPYTKPRA